MVTGMRPLGTTHRPLREMVCDAIREQIVNGVHRPGDRIVEDRMAAELGVSRSPVREALRVLETEGLVETIPRKGVVVATLSPEEVADIFEVRIALEDLAARLAARRADDVGIAAVQQALDAADTALQRRRPAELARLNTVFHEAVLDLAGNRYLRDVMIPLRGRMQWIFHKTAAGPRASVSLAQHRSLLDAIAAHDEDLAGKTAVEHVQSARATFDGYREQAGEAP